ncbi:transposon Ty3-I Gag-Pol polyprotein [Trichonephila clavipes]|nr:transposon Ty3-I Gag-Pol polyprotein [Trichonephila clavipes]
MEQKKDQDLVKLKLLSNSSKNENSDLSTVSFAGRILIQMENCGCQSFPKHLRADILRHFHDAPTAGHLGFAKTYDRIRKRILLAGNVPKCRSVCHALSGVPKEKVRSSTTTWTFSSHPLPAIAPFHRIGIDLLGEFPKSAHGNKWIIVCTDYSARYAITKPCRQPKSTK